MPASSRRTVAAPATGPGTSPVNRRRIVPAWAARWARRVGGVAGILTIALILHGVQLARIAASQETPPMPRWNVPLPTLGGTQLWTDHRIRGGCRVQQNSLTSHWRFLDDNNIRRAWGSRSEVLSQFEAKCPRPESATRPTVVLIHGLMRTDQCMKPLEDPLTATLDIDTMRFGYASTRQTLAESAAALRAVLEDQPADATFAFIGHSMGNIVVRRMIHDLETGDDPTGLLARCTAMVMLGPPNNGASIARRLSSTGVFEWVAGPGAMELGSRWESVVETLAVPKFPFAIVAGNVADAMVANPLVDGPGDFVVSLDEARLPGAQTVQEVPVLHSFLMNDPVSQAFTTSWLKEHGGFADAPKPDAPKPDVQ